MGSGGWEEWRAEPSGGWRIEDTGSILIFIISQAVIGTTCQSRLVGISWKPDQSEIIFISPTFERVFSSFGWKVILVSDISYQHLSIQLLFNMVAWTHAFVWIPSLIPLKLEWNNRKGGKRRERRHTSPLPPAWNGDWYLEWEKPFWNLEYRGPPKGWHKIKRKDLGVLMTWWGIAPALDTA